METEIHGVYLDFGDVKQAQAWGAPVLRVARRLQGTNDKEESVALRLVLRNGSFVHAVSFPLTRAPAAVDSLAGCI